MFFLIYNGNFESNVNKLNSKTNKYFYSFIKYMKQIKKDPSCFQDKFSLKSISLYFSLFNSVSSLSTSSKS